MKLILSLFGLFWSGLVLAQTSARSLIIHQNVLSTSRSTQQTPTDLLAYNQIQPHASAFYTAGQSITLQPGFEAQAGSVLAATIGPVTLTNGEPSSRLQARLLGNPVVGNNAEVEIVGVTGQSLTLRLIDLQGRSVHEQRIEQAGETERVSLPLGQSRGQLLLKVSTDTQQQSLKLVRP